MQVQTHIKVVMEMTLDEARELEQTLQDAPGSSPHWQALANALQQVKDVKVEA